MRILTGKDRIAYETALQEASLVRSLEAELDRLRVAYERERQRADTAVDTLLTERGLPPVTPASVEDLRGHNVFQPRPEKVAEVEAQYQAMGFGRKP